ERPEIAGPGGRPLAVGDGSVSGRRLRPAAVLHRLVTDDLRVPLPHLLLQAVPDLPQLQLPVRHLLPEPAVVLLLLQPAPAGLLGPQPRAERRQGGVLPARRGAPQGDAQPDQGGALPEAGPDAAGAGVEGWLEDRRAAGRPAHRRRAAQGGLTT